MYCVAFDPGGTTGICVVPSASNPWYTEELELGPKPHHAELAFILRTLWKPELMICEAFENVTNEAALLVAVEYIGIVKMHAEEYGVELHFQSASIAKQFWTNDKLGRVGKRTKGRHARDALRHYLYYRTFTLKDLSLLRKCKV